MRILSAYPLGDAGAAVAGERDARVETCGARGAEPGAEHAAPFDGRRPDADLEPGGGRVVHVPLVVGSEVVTSPRTRPT